MKSSLQQKIDSMRDCYLEICKDYKWENDYSRHFAALTYTLKDKSFEKEKIEYVKKIIKDNTGIFSNYRGYTSFILAMLLCSEHDNSEGQVIKMLNYDRKLRDAGFKNSMYLPVASYALFLTCDDALVDKSAAKAYEIYVEMKKNHPWLTFGDDYPLCVLLANSQGSINSTVENIEECYRYLKEFGFSKGNGLQFLSHILSFSSEDNRIKSERCRDIFQTLKENKLKLYSNYYAALGFLTIVGNDNKEAISNVIDVASYLKSLKKYKWLGNGMNVLIASSIVCDEYIREKKVQKDLVATTLSISIEALIAAQTAAMVAGISASTAAANSSAGS
jgi:hypothetical protein